MAFQHFSEYYVWQKAMDLVDEVYKLTRYLPPDEKYVLSSQLRRAAISIPSNIAEGSGRQTDRDLRNFLYIARGSTYEVETQIRICLRQRLITKEQAEPILQKCSEIAKMLYFFAEKLKT